MSKLVIDDDALDFVSLAGLLVACACFDVYADDYRLLEVRYVVFMIFLMFANVVFSSLIFVAPMLFKQLIHALLLLLHAHWLSKYLLVLSAVMGLVRGSAFISSVGK
jgi:hypothetical protein